MAMEFSGSIKSVIGVSVSEDKMAAFIQLIDADGASSITKEAIVELLQANGVIYGYQEEAMAQFAGNPLAYKSRPIQIAAGNPPIHGEDGSIRCLYNMNNNERKPLQLEDGTMDFREIVSLNNVTKGQLIAERIPAAKGDLGTAVTGESVPGRDGKEAHFKLGKNVVADPEKKCLYAVIDGLVTETEKGKLNVFPVYEVNGDVDYHIGNIDFVGTVVIRGSVLAGFRVHASGDIRITGGVEGAEVESGGSIEIANGVFAGNKGYVKAGVNFKSSFVQEANISAGEDVVVTQSIMHSHVKAGKNVICTGPKGLIVGGTIQAGEKVLARTVGNTMSTNVTAIEVGVAPELREELLELKQKVKDLNEGLVKTEQALNLLDQMAAAGTLTADKLELRKKLTGSKKAANEELTAGKERMLEIEELLDDIERAKVEVIGTIYSGSKIVIGRYTRFIKDATTRVAFQLEGGEITLSSHF